MHFTNDTNLWGKNMEMVPIGSYWFLFVSISLNKHSFKRTLPELRFVDFINRVNPP